MRTAKADARHEVTPDAVSLRPSPFSLRTSRSFTPSLSPIALTWLERLRWVAVLGQLLAVTAAAGLFGLRVPYGPVVAVVSLTAITNTVLVLLRRRGRVPGWLVPAVIALDVVLLTVLLGFTGGPDNPFAMLFLVHVALATVLLGTRGAWAILALCGACYGLLFLRHVPLDDDALTDNVRTTGEWFALLLIGGLIVYFTERVLAALRARERAFAEAQERALRNEGFTTLAAGAAHELGTPLATIAIVAGELQRQAEGELRDDLSLIKSEVDRCRRVIDRMRGEIAEGAALAQRRAEWPEVVERVRTALGEQSARLWVTSDDVPAIAVQPRVLEQALVILIRNALDASPTGTATLAARTEGDRVRLQVLDEGEGMSPEVLRRAAEPFFTTKPPGKGMGLGLFLVRLTADRNDGTFTLDSTPGVGTSATLTLPAAR